MLDKYKMKYKTIKKITYGVRTHMVYGKSVPVSIELGG